MEELFSDVRRFFRSNPALLVWLLIAVALSYGFAIANVSLSIDEELQLTRATTFDWAAQGRWGITLIKVFFGTVFPLPFFQPFASAGLLFLSATVWCTHFIRITNDRLNRSPWIALFAVLYLTMPCNAYYFSFNTYNVEVSAGMLLASLSVYFSFLWADNWRGRPFTLLLAVLSATFSFSVYQSLTLVNAAALIASYLLYLEVVDITRRPSHTEVIRKLVFLFVPTVIGFISYRIVEFLFVAAGSYTDVFLNWGKLNNDFIVQSLWNYIVTFFSGDGFIGGEIVIPLAIAGLAGLTIAVTRAVRFHRMLELLLFCIVLMSPFVLSLGLGTPMPNRTQQVFPLVYSAVILILIVQFGLERRAQGVAVIAISVAIFWNGEANTRLFFSEYLTFKRDVSMAEELAGRFYLSGWSGAAAPLVIIGQYSRPSERFLLRSETIGASLFEWDDGERSPALMRVLGYRFTAPTAAQREKAIALSASLPDWPRLGSVVFVDGVAIAKMGEPTENQRERARLKISP